MLNKQEDDIIHGDNKEDKALRRSVNFFVSTSWVFLYFVPLLGVIDFVMCHDDDVKRFHRLNWLLNK